MRLRASTWCKLITAKRYTPASSVTSNLWADLSYDRTSTATRHNNKVSFSGFFSTIPVEVISFHIVQDDFLAHLYLLQLEVICFQVGVSILNICMSSLHENALIFEQLWTPNVFSNVSVLPAPHSRECPLEYAHLACHTN